MRALALMLAALCAVAQAQTPAMGRLFTTSAERERIDQQRGGGSPPPPAPLVTTDPVRPQVAAAAPVSVDGIVHRKSGKTTVWLNQVPQDAPAGAPSVYPVPLPAGGSVLLKPGQSVDLATGARRDLNGAR